MNEMAEDKKETLISNEMIQWTLTAQTLLILLFMFLLYLKGEKTQHLNTILTGAIFVYDFKRHQEIRTKRVLVDLVILGLIFAFSLITTLQLIDSL